MLKKELIEHIEAFVTEGLEDLYQIPKDQLIMGVERPKDPTHGDFAFPCFPLARTLRTNPALIARELANHLQENLQPNTLIKDIQVIGGYVNFWLAYDIIVSHPHFSMLTDAGKKQADYLQEEYRSYHKVSIEFASPNTNKPLHLGHMRNIAIGESMARVFALFSDQVIKTEVVNDRGIAIAKMMLIYDRFYKGQEPSGKPDHFAGDLYVEFEEQVAKNPELEQEAQDILKAWEEGDEYWHSIWRKLRDWVVEGQHQTYQVMQTSFDERVFESDIYQEGKDIVLQGLDKKVLKKDIDKGYVYADLEEFGLPNKILLRSNGTSLYITQDIALLNKRLHGDSLCKGSDIVIYVTDFSQTLQFRQLFAIAHLLGIAQDSLHHIGYGAIRRKEGKMSSRKGNVVHADNLIQQLEDLVHQTYFQDSGLDTSKIQSIARAAYMYYLVSTSAQKDMIFDEAASISLEGKTGPYILYTYARIRSLVGKSQVTSHVGNVYKFESERLLIMQAIEYFHMIDLTKRSFDPAILAHFLYELSVVINSYYHETQVIGSEYESERVALLDIISRILRNGLSLLAIDTLEEM